MYSYSVAYNPTGVNKLILDIAIYSTFLYIMSNFTYIFLMTLTTQVTRIVVGVNEKGYRVGTCHHNCTISDILVDALRDLHEDYGIGYGTLSKMFNISRGTIAKICRYERRADYPDRFKTIQVR